MLELLSPIIVFVLKLIVGLNEGYDNVATFIQQSDPFQPFYDARSRLILEKTRKNKQAASAAITSGTAPTQCNHYILISTAARATYDQSNRGRGKTINNQGGGRNGGGRGRGRGRSQNNQQYQFLTINGHRHGSYLTHDRISSVGDLYPITTSMLQQLSSPSTFAAISQDL
ncbi:hypothetical protein Tco_0994386 [Tanacetum coccineum]